MGDTQGTLGTHGRCEDIVAYVEGQVGHEGHMRDRGDTCVHEGDGGTWGHRVAILCLWGGAVLEMIPVLGGVQVTTGHGTRRDG